MIADLKPYEEYRPTDFPWLGEIPSHWSTRRIKTVLQELNVRSDDGRGTLLSLSRRRGLVPRSDITDKAAAAKTLVGYKLYYPGQIVMNRMQAWSGMFGAANISGLVSPDYAVYKLREDYDVRYLLQRIRNGDMVSQYRVESKGIGTGFNRLYDDKFGAIRVSIAPCDEQELIVRFLDWASVRLEKAIRAKRRVIALLEEQKQAIIHRAVTRGLDDTVPLKPSGLDWLGGIPEHWEVRRLKTIVSRIDQGVSPLASSYLADDNSWGVLKSGCVNGGVFRQKEHKRLDAGFRIDPDIVVHVGDILISRACGSVKYVGSVGRIGQLDYKLILSDKTFRPVFRKYVDEDFIVYALNSGYYRKQVEEALSGAEGLANNLPVSSLRTFRVLLPPPAEAAEIAGYVAKETDQLDSSMLNYETQCELLREYRTRLISDVVTGKLDVRDVARSLPSESEAMESINDMTTSDVDFAEDELETELAEEAV